jgi:hypothetical protein
MIRKSLLSISSALFLNSCSPYSSGKAQEVQNPVGITCENILSNTVSDDQVHNFVMHQKWSSWEKLMALYGMEAIIKDADRKEPISIDGLSTLKRHYAEIRELERKWKDLSEQEQLEIQNRHLIDLFQVFFRNKVWLLLFPQCLSPMKKVMT